MTYNESPIELTAPAGSLEALDAAIGEGADAVYLGLRDFNARIRAKNFSYNQVEAIVEKVHEKGKKVFITLNTLFEEKEVNRVYNLLKYLEKVGPDGVIVQDLGAIELINSYFPSLKIHASTQMNLSSATAVNFLSRYKVKRAVLSRELDLEQIKLIKAKTNAELEVFAHGSLCVCISGICLFSSYFGGKSANRGRCAQACRRLYRTESGKQGYFFSPKDVMLVKYIPELINHGINSIKIEGRMKSYQYIATVVSAYRYMIDNYLDDREAAFAKASEMLKGDFARRKTEFLFMDQDNRDFLTSAKSGETGIFLGKIKDILKRDEEKYCTLNFVKDGSLSKGDTVRFHSKDDKNRKSLKITNLIEDDGITYLPLPDGFRLEDSLYLVQKAAFHKRYPKLLPKNLKDYKKHPGISKLPDFKKEPYSGVKGLPAGLYVKINELKQLYMLQSEKPKKIIFHLNLKEADMLLPTIKKTSLTFKDFLIYLEPYMPENDEKDLKNIIDYLVEHGVGGFIANNMGHLSLLKSKKTVVIAGPYLYSLNRYSMAFLKSAGCSHLVTPLENNKRNAYLSTERFDRRDFFITVFSFPEMFQMKAPINKIYDDKTFTDNINKYEFYMMEKGDTVSLMPQKPFSIIDKIPDLKKKGFDKFIIDLAFMETKKSYYKKIIRYANEGRIIEETSRFNWKDGFYRDKIEKETPSK